MGFTRFSGHLHLASKLPLKLGWADVMARLWLFLFPLAGYKSDNLLAVAG